MPSVNPLRRWWDYLRWRLHGSPLVAGAPTTADWLGRMQALTPTVTGGRRLIVVPMSPPAPALLESLRAQSHPQWTLHAPAGMELGMLAPDPRVIRVGSGGTGDVLHRAAVDFPDALFVLIFAGVTLESHALAWLATAPGDADLAYADHLAVGWGGAVTPVLKPAWSPRLLLSDNYVGGTIALGAGAAGRVGAIGGESAELLRRLAVQGPLRVAHLPVPLTREAGGGVASRSSSRRDPEVTVKVVIPTRDRVDLLDRAVAGVRAATGVIVDLVVVDNGSREEASQRYLVDLVTSGARVIRVDEPFNFSRLINAGARAGAPTDLLLILNNDIEMSDPRWLSRLCGWLSDPGVVGVGPKLVFPDGRIQHAGMVQGLGGIAGHYAIGLRRVPELGPPDLPREVSCLTGACLVVRTRDFEAVGGFDENLAIDHQDVDLCLRLRRLGGELVYDPTVPLIHLQMATRDPAVAGNEETVRRMRAKWGTALEEPDPFWNPNLGLVSPGGGLAALPPSDAELQHRLQWRLRVVAPITD